MLAATGINVALRGTPVLADVSIEVPAGQVTAVLGPNGSGKTTLLRALSGEIGHAGRITLNGREIGGLKPFQAAALRAVLPQATALSFPFTVREVVALGLAAGIDEAGAPHRPRLPERALERVDLAGFGPRLYQDLSGGEQQRVQLARVLCQVWTPVVEGVPRYLLLDEPVSSLDIRHQLAIMGIARAFADLGGGVLAILHDLNLAAMFAHRIVLMRQGGVAAAGAPGDVLRDDLLEAVFGAPLRAGVVPAPDMPFVLPQAADSRPTRVFP